MRGMIGADRVDDALGNAAPEALAMGGIADRRVELGERAEPLVAVGRCEREMGGRRLGRGDVLVLGEESGLFLAW